MDEKKVKELLRDLVVSAQSVLNLINEKALFGDDQESEMFTAFAGSKQYDDLEQAVFRALGSEAAMQKQYQKLADAVGVMLDFIGEREDRADGNPVDTKCTPYLVMQKEYFNSVNAGFVEE